MALWPRIKRAPAWMKDGGELSAPWPSRTTEAARWESLRQAGRRWGWCGGGLGLLWGLVACAPAAWLAQEVAKFTAGRLLLADARGTIWRGDAVAVLTGGAGSRDAQALPGRLNWSMHLRGWGLSLTLQQDCCLPQPVVLVIQPGWGRVRAEVGLQASPSPMGTADGGFTPLGHWPAAWLSGLGTPWNTLQLGGVLRLDGQALALEWVEGRVRVAGQALVSLDNVSSRVSTLDRLGSYRLDLRGDAQGQLQMNLSTVDGALLLSGAGGVSASGLRFRGEARASEAAQGVLDNLLNIIGRRVGDRSVISIG